MIYSSSIRVHSRSDAAMSFAAFLARDSM